MNNALRIESNIDATKLGVAAIEDSHSASTSTIQPSAPLRAALEDQVVPLLIPEDHLCAATGRRATGPAMDARLLDLFADEEA